MNLILFVLCGLIQEKRIIEARQQSEETVAEQSKEIMEKSMKKMEDALANRENQIRSLQDKIKEHVRVYRCGFITNLSFC